MNRSISIFITAFMIALAGMAGVPASFMDHSGSFPDQQGLTERTTSVADPSNSGSSSILTLSGANPVTLSPNGSITRVAGKNVRLLPGTRISAGGFVYAPVGTGEKPGKPSHREKKLVTIEEKEKIDVQRAMEKAASLISPFPVNRKGQIRSGEPADGHFMSLAQNDMAVVQEHQTKPAGIYNERFTTNLMVSHVAYPDIPEFRTIRNRCAYVLRL